jgi:hypothetical protein
MSTTCDAALPLRNLKVSVREEEDVPSPEPANRDVANRDVATRAVDALAAAALEHRAVRHPYLAALAEGNLPDPDWALADFARHYEGYSAHFPRYLTALISRLENPTHRRALLENLTEESGQYAPGELEALAAIGVRPEWIVGIPHPELFHRFRLAAAGPDEAGTALSEAGEHLEVVCWR